MGTHIVIAHKRKTNNDDNVSPLYFFIRKFALLRCHYIDLDARVGTSCRTPRYPTIYE